MRLTPFIKFTLTSALSAFSIATLGFIFFAVARNVQESRNNLNTIVSNITSSEKDRDRIIHISDLLKDRAQDINRLTSLSVNRARPLQFIERIEEIGHVTNTILALSVDEAKGDANSLIFRATIDGTEASVRSALRLIEALPYQLAIENFSFQRDSGQQVSLKPPAHLTIAMRIKTQ